MWGLPVACIGYLIGKRGGGYKVEKVKKRNKEERPKEMASERYNMHMCRIEREKNLARKNPLTFS